VRDFELHLLTRKGNRLAVLDTVTTAHDRDGNLVGYRCLMRDVTGERRLADQFRHSQKMDAIGRLAGGVAHDFNNLLTVISGYSDLGLAQAAAAEPLREHFVQIQRAARRATDLTRQLLAFSRQQDLQLRRLDLNQVIREFEDFLRRSVSDDILLETVFEPDLWAVEADPGQIEQVLMNLVLNARDAMPQGGRLVIETRNVTIRGLQPDDREHWIEPGDYAALLVSDTGCGMDAATQSRIFEPFFTTKPTGQGTGLGLAVSVGLLEQHGGTLTLENRPGAQVGARFVVRLPLAKAVTPERRQTTNMLETATGMAPEVVAGNVLVIDDEPAVRSTIVRIFRRWGWQVREAGSGREALEILADPVVYTPGLLLCDLKMPEMSGAEFYRTLQARHSELVQRLIFVTGDVVEPDTAQFLGGSGREVVEKPFTMSEIARAVERVVRQT
jgi:signal transduction histidine kinase/CheY-like chemotaxis protein